MIVKELIAQLRGMPKGSHVYINQEGTGACMLAKSVTYSDSLGDLDSEDDSNMTDGVVISTLDEDEDM